MMMEPIGKPAAAAPDIERGIVSDLPKTESACGTLFRDWGQGVSTVGAVASIAGAAYTVVLQKYPVAALFGVTLVVEVIDFFRIRSLRPEHDMETDLTKSRQQMAISNKMIEDQRATITKLQASLGSVNGNLDEFNKSQIQDTQKRDEQLKQVSDLTARLEASIKEYQTLKALFDKMEAEAKSTAVLNAALQAQIEDQKKTVTLLTQQNTDLSKSTAALKTQVTRIDEENSEYAKNLEKQETQQNELKKRIEDLTATVDQIRKEKEALLPIVEKANHLEETNKGLQAKLDRMQDLEKQLATQLAEFKAAKASAKKP